MVSSLHADNDSLELNEDPSFGEEHQGGLLQSSQSPAQNEPNSSSESTGMSFDIQEARFTMSLSQFMILRCL